MAEEAKKPRVSRARVTEIMRVVMGFAVNHLVDINDAFCTDTEGKLRAGDYLIPEVTETELERMLDMTILMYDTQKKMEKEPNGLSNDQRSAGSEEKPKG